jgi:DNA-binding NarL/FixJ family response regulator
MLRKRCLPPPTEICLCLAWVRTDDIEGCEEKIADNMRLKLLVADDNPSMRAMLVSMLQCDFDLVGIVANGQEAVEAASKLMPDVLIFDISMPILDGIEAAMRLKAQGCNAKIVFVSFMDVDPVKAFIAAGGAAFVSKSRIATDLVLAIREVLAGRIFVSPEA